MIIEVKNINNRFKIIGVINRKPQWVTKKSLYNKWQNGYNIINYKNKRYVLNGGIRNNHFIAIGG